MVNSEEFSASIYFLLSPRMRTFNVAVGMSREGQNRKSYRFSTRLRIPLRGAVQTHVTERNQAEKASMLGCSE